MKRTHHLHSIMSHQKASKYRQYKTQSRNPTPAPRFFQKEIQIRNVISTKPPYSTKHNPPLPSLPPKLIHPQSRSKKKASHHHNLIPTSTAKSKSVKLKSSIQHPQSPFIKKFSSPHPSRKSHRFNPPNHPSPSILIPIPLSALSLSFSHDFPFDIGGPGGGGGGRSGGG